MNVTAIAFCADIAVRDLKTMFIRVTLDDNETFEGRTAKKRTSDCGGCFSLILVRGDCHKVLRSDNSNCETVPHQNTGETVYRY